MFRRIVVLSVAALALAACDDATGPENQAVVNVAFGTTTASRSASADRTALQPIKASNTVVDLSAYDYTGSEDDILELEAEFEKGVTKIEWEEHD